MAEVTSIRASAGKWLTDRLPRGMEAVGIRAVGLITQELDTPYPPASSPGESPHKRTGNLQAGIEHTERREGDDFVTRISSARAEGDERVPVYLEFGTKKMAARPYMRPVMNQTPQLMPESIRQSLSSEATYATSG